MRSKFLGLLVLICLAGFSGLSLPVHGVEMTVPSFEMYVPARVVVSFSYTQNVTVHVATVGHSLYKAITGPTSVEFNTQAIDIYTVQIGVLYTVAQNQTVTIGIFETGRPAKSIELTMTDKYLTLLFRLSVVQAPTFPTADDIADAMLLRWQNQLKAFEVSQGLLTDKMSSTVVTIGSIAVIAFVVCVLCLFLELRTQKKVADLSARGITG